MLNFKMGLRGKSVLVLGSLVLTALLVMGGAIYYQATTLTMEELMEATGNSIDKDVIETENLVRSSRDDLMVIADTPPIQGIIRARDNQGQDPLTGDKAEYWYARLEQIFGAFMTNHPEMYQVRYLDLKGDEIVRTTRTGTAIKNTPRPELENMAQYPCFSETILLKPKQAYYSEVNLSREQGVLQIPHTPLFRLATPIYDATNAVRGVVVLNLFAEAMFSPVRRAQQGTKKYLINQNGFFLVHPDRAKEYGFDLGFGFGLKDEMREYPDVSALPERFVEYHKTERRVHGNHKIHYDQVSMNRYWTLLCEIPESVALRKIYPARNMMLIVGFFIAIISFAAITWIATRKMVTPILRLSTTVRMLENGDLAARVREDGLVDEIGELASSINRMAGTIEKNITELSILNRITVAASASLSIEGIARNTLAAILELQLLKFEKKAAIFVADDAAKTLRLVASHGFSEEQRALDAVVPYGECLCGRAAETGETICSERCCDNPYHTRKYPGITPHGHLIIPFKSREKVLGVLVLYLAADALLSSEATRIYTSIADVLAVSFQNAVHFSNIEQLKNQHGLILTSLGEGLYGLDADGICTFINPAAERMLGYETGELVGALLHAITHHTRPDGSVYPKEECRIYASFVKNTVYRVDDEVFWKKDGSSFPVEYTSTPLLRDESGAAMGAVVVFSDISERNKMERAIQESNERYAALYEGIDDALFVHRIAADGSPGKFLEVNSVACQRLGYSRDELLALSPADIDAVEPDTDITAVAEQIIAGSSVTFTVTHVAKDGRRIPVEIRSCIILLQGQKAVMSLARDITERKRVENQERNRSRILESLTSGAALASILELIVRSFEAEDPEALCSILLLDEEGKHLLNAAAPSLPDFYNQAIHGIEIGAGVGSCGTAAFTKQRVIAADLLLHPFWANFRDLTQKANLRSCWSEPILTAEKRVLGTFAIYYREPREPGFADIERIKAAADYARLAIERKRAEERISGYAEQYQAMLSAALFGFWLMDEKGKILDVNDAYCTMSGYTREELLSLSVFDLSTLGNIDKLIRRILETGMARFESRHKAKDGRLFDVEISATFWSSQRKLVVFVSDITERKKMDDILKRYSQRLEKDVAERTKVIEDINIELQAVNKELEQRRVEAESATRAKSDFLANMSHELRTPLNSILGFSEIMRDGLAGEVSVQQKEYLTDVWESGSHLLGLINDILDISKIEAGKMELELGEFDLHVLMSEALVFFREKATRHGISLHREAADDLPAIVADERKIKQVLINLLTNALKFTPDGGEVGICMTRDGGEVRISVWDTGIGIAPEDLNRLFQPFQQLESPLTKKHEGTGLGLSLSRKIVELHRGRIWVESTPGEGSRFTFAIPITPVTGWKS